MMNLSRPIRLLKDRKQKQKTIREMFFKEDKKKSEHQKLVNEKKK